MAKYFWTKWDGNFDMKYKNVFNFANSVRGGESDPCFSHVQLHARRSWLYYVNKFYLLCKEFYIFIEEEITRKIEYKEGFR